MGTQCDQVAILRCEPGAHYHLVVNAHVKVRLGLDLQCIPQYADFNGLIVMALQV